jgi:hypothetical protein
VLVLEARAQAEAEARLARAVLVQAAASSSPTLHRKVARVVRAALKAVEPAGRAQASPVAVVAVVAVVVAAAADQTNHLLTPINHELVYYTVYNIYVIGRLIESHAEINKDNYHFTFKKKYQTTLLTTQDRLIFLFLLFLFYFFN